MIKKDGVFYLIDSIHDYKLIEVLFKGEENRPLYKVYAGKNCIEKWRSTVDLHSMSDFDIVDSDDYSKFTALLDDVSPEVITYDIFGLPEDSKLGTKYGNREINQKNFTSKTPASKGYSTHSSKWSNYYNSEPKETTGLAANLKNSDTLVIHCADNSTDMLSQIYEGKGWDVIRDGSIAESELHELLACHSRVVMLGHGTGSGLINVQHSKGSRWTVIDSRYVEDLKNKKLFVIWCNADKFFTDNNIGQGQFITGNMPSEVWECSAAGCGYITAQEMLDNITYWSKLCADVVERCLNGDVAGSVKYIRENYIKAYGTHPVTKYNCVRTKVQGTSYDQNEKEVDELYRQLGVEIQKQEPERVYHYPNSIDSKEEEADSDSNNYWKNHRYLY